MCTLVKIQDSESHTLVDGTCMLRSPESLHLYPLPFPTPSVHEKTLKLRMVKTKCIWPHTLITTKAYLHRLPWIYNQLTLRIWICQHAHYKFTVKSTYFTMYTRYNQGSLCKIKAMKWRTQIDIGNKRISSAVWRTINVKMSSLKFSLQPPLVYSLVKRGFIIQTSVLLPGY